MYMDSLAPFEIFKHPCFPTDNSNTVSNYRAALIGIQYLYLFISRNMKTSHSCI